jgi:long-chain acyl-CoA synthetase
LKSKTPDTQKFIGIYATNRIEWTLTYLGAAQQCVTIVPLYDTLGADAVQFCVNQSELTIIVCDNNKRAKMLLDCAKNMPSLRTIVLMDVDSEGKGRRIVLNEASKLKKLTFQSRKIRRCHQRPALGQSTNHNTVMGRL